MRANCISFDADKHYEHNGTFVMLLACLYQQLLSKSVGDLWWPQMTYAVATSEKSIWFVKNSHILHGSDTSNLIYCLKKTFDFSPIALKWGGHKNDLTLGLFVYLFISLKTATGRSPLTAAVKQHSHSRAHPHTHIHFLSKSILNTWHKIKYINVWVS